MSATLTVTNTARETTIKVRGDLDYDINGAFKSAYASLFQGPGRIAHEALAVDMADVDRIDSAGLGMLLILLEYAKRQSLKVILMNPNARTRAILEMVHFQRLFTIH